MPFERTVNLSDPQVNAMVCDAIRREEGLFVVSVKEPTRSHRQNAYYWSQIVEPLAHWYTVLEGQTFTKDDVHRSLKKHWLQLQERTDPITGEVEWVEKSTARLTKSDFAVLLEKGHILLDQVRGQVATKRREMAGAK